MILRAVIIDDEPDAVASLSALIKQFINGAEVVATAASALEGVKMINQLKPDVVLLDIDMPGGNGFDLLDALPGRDFKVIFTTASRDFAIMALKARAEDYLLKPIDPEELQQALDKIRDNRSNTANTIALPDQYGYTYVKIKDIVHLKGQGNYTTVYHAGQQTIVSKNIKYFEELLQPHPFFRCHQSHIINLAEVKQLKKDEGIYLIMSNGNRADVSRVHKDTLLKLLNGQQ